MPIVKPVPPGLTAVFNESEAVEPLTQVREVKFPQEPETSCIITPAPLKDAPMLLNEIVGYDVWATKEYQTSAPGVPAQELVGTGEVDVVAPAKVPGVLLQVLAEVNVVAFTQLSLTGGGSGCVRQMVKAAPALVEDG